MLWVRPTSLDKTLPLRSVVFTPAGPPSQRSLQAGGSLAQETSETLNSWPNTTVSLSPSPPQEGHQPYHHCFMPSTACQCLPVTQAVWMGLDITLPQGPSHALHLLGMPQRLHSPHAWQDPNLCSHVHSFPTDTHHLKPTEQFNFSMSTPILKTAKHPESCTCSYLLASHPAPAPAVLFLSPLLHANPKPPAMLEFEIHPRMIYPKSQSPRQNHLDQRDEF